MTKASSILKFIGEKFGANPETLPTTSKTLVGGLTEVANKATQNATNLSALTTRVDEIIAPSGEAPNPAEVVDARIGADGVTYNNLGTANRTQFSDVKSAINYLEQGFEVIGCTRILNKGFNRSDGTFPDEANWDITDFIPVNGGETLYVDNPLQTTNYNGWYTSDKTYIEYFSVSQGTNIPMSVPSNAAYAVFSNSHSKFSFAFRRELNNLATKAEVKNLSNRIFAPDVACNASEAKGVVKKTNWNCTASSTKIEITPLNGYDSYYLLTDRDYDIYIDSLTASYFAICFAIGNVSITETESKVTINGDSCKRLRSSDSNLPSENNKLHIPANSYLSFTMTSGDGQLVSGLGEDLADTFSKLINDSIDFESVYLQYTNGNGDYYSTERINVYVPSENGFIDYEFSHAVRAEVNSDIWRMAVAYACNEHFVRTKQLTVSGEWELAMHQSGRTDFSGGVVHGNQVMTDINVFVDDKLVDITDYATLTKINKLSVIETSNLYDNSDSTALIAEVGSKHTFDASGLKIKQSLLWKVNTSLTSCYMAMHLPSKTYTDKAYADDDYATITLNQSAYTYTHANSKSVTVYSDDVYTECGVLEYPNENNGNILRITDNGGLAYNKCYFAITDSQSVTENTLWRAESYYRFNA